MTLPAAGVRLVAEDATKFDSAIKSAGSVLDGFGKTASAVTASVNNAFSGMASAIGGILAPVGRLFNHIFVSVIRSVVNDAVHAMERFARSVIDAAIEGTHLQDSIERLGVSLKSVANSAFKPLTDKLGEMVDSAAPAFLGIVEAAESYLGGLGANALTWGSNFVNQFAQGMWNAVGNILSVLTEIANLITYWLSPGSPPRLLPDIDKWGTAAAGEYFGGWTKGAFSWFNDLSGTLSNLIRSIPLPKGDQVGVIPSILGARQGIAAAVEELRTTGAITTSTMDAITRAVGTSDDSVRAYLESMVRLTAAGDLTREAQAELNKVTKAYQDLLKPIDAELAGITEEQQQLADANKKSLLQLVLNDPNATLSEKRQAQLEIERMDAEKRRRAMLLEQGLVVDAAKDKLDAAKEAEQLAQDDFDARKALILAQTEQNNLLKEQLRLLESLNKASGAGGGPKPAGGGKPVIPPFGITLPDFSKFIPGDILAKWNKFVAAFEALWGRIVTIMQPAVDAWNNIVMPAWDRLVDAIIDSIPMMESAIARMVAFTIREMGVMLPPVLTNLGHAIDSLTQIWRNHSATVIAVIGGTYLILVALVSAAMIAISGIVALTLNSIAGTFDLWSALFEGNWTLAWDVTKETVRTAWEIIKTTIRGALDAILLLVNTDLATVESIFSTIMTNIATTIVTGPLKALQDLLQAAKELWQWLNDHVFSFVLPGVPGMDTIDKSQVNGPSSSVPGGGNTYNTSSSTGGNTYAPTYVSNAPPPSAGFATMAALFG